MVDIDVSVGLVDRAADKASPEIIPLEPLSPAIGSSSTYARRPSDAPSLSARRGLQMSLPSLPARSGGLKRPNIAPLQRADSSPLNSSQRSVRFDAMPSFTSAVSADVESQSARTLLPAPSSPSHEPAPLLWFRTRYRPLYLLGLGNTGAWLFGSGEVVLQRAVWPVAQYTGLNNEGPTAIPAGTAGHGPAFGGPTGGIIGGSILMAVGIAFALTACGLFVRDGRALNRRQNPAVPNYRRTMGYFYCHLVGILMLCGHRFVIETFRLKLGPRWQWVAATPGALGQAIFAITQAQAFSSCEVYRGRMPLKHRGAISATARAGVAFYVVLAAILGTPNFTAYGREVIRLLAQTSSAVAYSLPLTTARLSQPPIGSPIIEVGEMRYRGDWTAIQIFAVYALARMISMLGAYWLEHARWPTQVDLNGGAFTQGANVTGWAGFPPPLPTGEADFDGVSCASFLLTGATLLGFYSFYQFGKDAKPPLWRANVLGGLACLCLVMGQIYRVLTENAKAHANFHRVWQAMPIGFMANAIAFVVIPEMFARSEVSRGNSPIPYRYQVTELCRFTGNLCFVMWAAMSGVIGFPPLARMMMNWTGSVFSILGMALPDAQTRKNQTGSLGTPQGEPRSWLEAHTRST